jgi:hypothetical protein
MVSHTHHYLFRFHAENRNMSANRMSHCLIPRRKKARAPNVREIVLRFVVEHDVQPNDITKLFSTNMPTWMADYATVAISRQRRPTKEETESLCCDTDT